MDIVKEMREIVFRIDNGEALGPYEAGMLDVAIIRLEQAQPAWHPDPPVRRINRLFPGRQVVTSGPDGEGLFPLYAVASTTVTRAGESCELAELCFDWDSPL